jgi:hypothetical protein
VETSIRNLLIEQVREHLKALPVKDRVRELIYNHFLPQCNQYEIAEDAFYKQILKAAFREAEPAPEEDSDPPNRKGTFVKLFGVTLHSLKRLGEVLFEDAARAKIYFDDLTFLKAHVDHLVDADAAIEYTLLYKAENDPEKRFLKICYRLNSGLPYRIDGQLFDNLEKLLSAGFKSRSFMDKIYKDYGNGKLHIWLHALDSERFATLPDDKTVVSFLAFIYGTNAKYPFYIEQELFYSPMELVAKAKKNLDFWWKLITYCNNGNLFVWFDALGHPEWRGKLQKVSDNLQRDEQTGNDEKDHAMIQQLQYIIDSEAIRPLIVSSEAKIEKLSVAATQLIEVPVKVHLKTMGFVKVRVALEPLHKGLWLSTEQVVLFDLTGQKEVFVTLYIDPQQMIKNSSYSTGLQMTTEYETLIVPIQVKVVFPLRTYILYLFKYAFLGGLLFALFRWMISAGTGQPAGLSPQIITGEVVSSLPDNWPVFFWVFLAMLASLIGSYFVIRKVEKL